MPVQRRKAFCDEDFIPLRHELSVGTGEALDSWAVRLYESGAAAVHLDIHDAPKFAVITEEPMIQRVLRQGPENQGETESLLGMVQRGMLLRYPTQLDWPVNDTPWHGLADAVRRMKQETARLAVEAQRLTDLMICPLTVQVRNKGIKQCSPCLQAGHSDTACQHDRP